MIDDMAPLRKAMEQMDADDPAVSQAAKDRAAQILHDAKLSFSKLAEMIEDRRLLLRPKIVASIKRMDQPDMLGDAAFRDTGISLRREGQSFRQIAEAIELNGRSMPRREEPAQTSGPLSPMEMEGQLDPPLWLIVLNVVARIVFFPLRRPLRFFTIAPLAALLFYAARGPGTVSQQISGYFADVNAARQHADAAASSAGSFIDKQILRRSGETANPAASPTPPIAAPSSPAPSPSTAPAAETAHPAPAPSATAPAPAPAANPPSAFAPTAPVAPPEPTPRFAARGAPPSQPTANDRSRPRTLGELMLPRVRRNSQTAGPCIGGVGGCYWAGGRY